MIKNEVDKKILEVQCDNVAEVFERIKNTSGNVPYMSDEEESEIAHILNNLTNDDLEVAGKTIIKFI